MAGTATSQRTAAVPAKMPGAARLSLSGCAERGVMTAQSVPWYLGLDLFLLVCSAGFGGRGLRHPG